MTIAARYENGVFKPLEGVTIKEGTVVEIQIPAASDERSPSLRDLGFVGMWADRDDINDGVSYVNALRDNPRAAKDSAPEN